MPRCIRLSSQELELSSPASDRGIWQHKHTTFQACLEGPTVTPQAGAIRAVWWDQVPSQYTSQGGTNIGVWWDQVLPHHNPQGGNTRPLGL